MDEKCETCKYFDDRGEQGYCIRFPPVYVGKPEDWSFPKIYAIDWCGEWKEKPHL